MKTFSELPLKTALLQAIKDLNYQTPSPIQAKSIPILLEESGDFIGLAATGTGKTAAFSIPLLEKIDPSKKSLQALVLCPTRELAVQVSEQIKLLGKHLKIHSTAIYGGASFSEQLRALKAGAPIVVGTPGRLFDHLERGTLKLENVKTLILDEADEMISMGFKEHLEAILKSLPEKNKSIWLFSATMGKEVRKVADTYLHKPNQVQINKTEVLSKTVEQLYYKTQEHEKPQLICKLIDTAEDFYGLVFCQTKSLVIELTQYLKDQGYKVDCLHGDKDQNARERTMKSFRDAKIKILVCTDVASRGLDIQNVSHVINYSIPKELESYVHRIGRTARSGKTGFAMSLVTPSHFYLISKIEHMTHSRIKQGKVPSRIEIRDNKIKKIAELFHQKEISEEHVETIENLWKQSIATMRKTEIVGRFLSMLYPDLFEESSLRENFSFENSQEAQDNRSKKRLNNEEPKNLREKRRRKFPPHFKQRSSQKIRSRKGSKPKGKGKKEA